MKKLLTILSIAAVCCTACLKENESGTFENGKPVSKLVGNPFGEKMEGELLVSLSENAVEGLKDGNFDSERIFEGLEEASISPIFPGKANATARKHGLHKWHKLTFNSSVSVETAATMIAQHAEIEAIEYNSILKTSFSNESYEYCGSVTTKSTTSTSKAPFNDMLFEQQWDMLNDGSLEGSVAGADVGVKDAWKLSAGDPRIVVAVIDQGIATIHPDLKDALWVNDAEMNGADEKDDDNNGYTDDKHGYNFAENQGQPSVAAGSDHGTHVAGTIGATNNNRIGISSVAGGTGKGDGIRLMSCQAVGKKQETTPEWFAKAFNYAANHGASIAQCSYGHPEMNGISSAELEQWMSESIEYKAMKNFLDPANANCSALGGNIIVFSAGNQNNPASMYPGALGGCISVTAFCHDFLPGGYSNYGAGCDIAAPGGDIVKNSRTAPCMILSTGLNQDGAPAFTYNYGTSMACPHVSGVVALGLSYALKINKHFSRDEFISRLLSSTNNLDIYNNSSTMKLWVRRSWNSSNESWIDEYLETDVFAKKGKMGAGAVDAWKFLMALEGTPSFMTKPGQKISLDLSEVLGADYTRYTMEISEDTKEALGITDTPVVENGAIELTCTKIGSGKIMFKASVGKDENGIIPELEYYKEFSIVSRPSVASNGGWL